MKANRKTWCRVLVATAVLAGPITSLQAEEYIDPIVSQARQILAGHAERGSWQNAIVPAATGNKTGPSADRLMTAMLSRYTREMLDRGGWSNEIVSGDHYAAGEPLRTAAVGQGVTTRESAPAGLPVHIAAPSLHSAGGKS